jgi:hypothetical protein
MCVPNCPSYHSGPHYQRGQWPDNWWLYRNHYITDGIRRRIRWEGRRCIVLKNRKVVALRKWMNVVQNLVVDERFPGLLNKLYYNLRRVQSKLFFTRKMESITTHLSHLLWGLHENQTHFRVPRVCYSFSTSYESPLPHHFLPVRPPPFSLRH